MMIEDFRPTKADIELLLVSPEAAPLIESQLMRPRAGDEWRVPDMLAVRNGKGEEFTDRQWIENRGMGDEYAWRVVLTPRGLDLLGEVLIRENASQVYGLQLQVGSGQRRIAARGRQQPHSWSGEPPSTQKERQ